MSRPSPGNLALIGLIIVATGGACPPPLHVPPRPGSPAATVKFRINHHYYPGGRMAFRLWVDTKRVSHGEISYKGGSAAWTRVKPGWRRLDLGTWFYVIRFFTQTYSAIQNYPCGQRTCSRTVYKTRQVQQNLTQGQCARGAALFARDGHTYIVSYDYVGRQACTLTCNEQTVGRSGQVRLAPCASFQGVEAASRW